jgi:cellulose synthase/poly-beta-1,6-N-acetylglucosamine synthase-like glycosyltransferase
LRARRRPPQTRSQFPEIDCVRDLLPTQVIAAAERRAMSIGLGADRVLICADVMTEEGYLTALATSLGTFFDPLDNVSRASCPLSDDQLIQATAAGLLPVQYGDELSWIIAPRCLTARNLANLGHSTPQSPHWFRLTSPERLSRFAAQYAQRALGQRAAGELRRVQPHLSNAPRAASSGWIAMAASAAIGGAVFAAAPGLAIHALATSCCAAILAAGMLRLLCAFRAGPAPPQRPRIADHELPIYTVICPLYREGAVVRQLVAAIRALDYPLEKLDVKLVVEADDQETQQAVAVLDLGQPFTVIIAPPTGPRTKPKALNAALPFAYGTFTVVFDAEDVPEPDQLRRALDKFAEADDRLACVQAALTIDNTADGWLARMFTAGYAGQFDAFLPGLAALGLPLPLGGSSNHFRTAALRRVGGWDPYNVTEDADLGIRLHRLGYRSAAIASATYEEAPARFRSWLNQRARWYKGWMQTWLVHMRRPGRLVRDLRPAGAIAVQLFLACNVLAALVHPIFAAALGYSLLAGMPLTTVTSFNSWPIFAATFLCGYASTIPLDLIGLKRRRLLGHGWILALTPFYWFLLSLAAWRALIQLICDPQRWEKTEHGLARTSRLQARLSSSDD